jgi:nucleoside-diphosphate-sugar epimerase
MDPADGRVVSNFILAALNGSPMQIYGDGTQTRSFMYVDDLVRGLMLLMESDCNAVPVNLGNPQEYTMNDWAVIVGGLVRDYLGTDAAVAAEHTPASADDPKQRKPVIDRARELLGWEPAVPVLDGVQNTIAYFATAPALEKN